MTPRRAFVALAMTVLVGWWVPGVASAAVPTQDDETSSTTSIDAGSDSSGEDNPLLVPGPDADGSTPAPDTDADAPAATEEAQVDDAVDAGSSNDEAEDTVRLVMLALIGVAVALAALTAYYWWRTRPSRRSPEPRRRRTGPEAPDESESAPASDDAGTVGTWQTDSTSTR